MKSKRTNRQLASLTVATLAWVLCGISIALPQWRVWRFKDPEDSKPSMALVGMWRICVYQYKSNSNITRECYQYTYYDTFIPLDVRVAQHLLLVSCLFGMVATIALTAALRKLHSRRRRRKLKYKQLCHNPFCFPGILNIIASSFVFISILYNYLSIIRKDGIDFPPHFHTPAFPDSQKVGIALVMATLSSFFFLVGGIISLSFTLRLHSRRRSKI